MSRCIGTESVLGIRVAVRDLDQHEVFAAMITDYISFKYGNESLVQFWRAYVGMLVHAGATGRLLASFNGSALPPQALLAPPAVGASPPKTQEDALVSAPPKCTAAKAKPCPRKAEKFAIDPRLESKGVCDSVAAKVERDALANDLEDKSAASASSHQQVPLNPLFAPGANPKKRAKTSL